MRIREFLKNNLYTAIFLLLLVIIGVFLVWRNYFGIALNDESFYLTLPYRYIQGDALFKNEWHLAQMHGVILVPFVKLYLSIFGTTDGIIITFRHLYVFFHVITTCVIYFGLKKISKLGALLSSIVYLVYIPFGIPALSYNTIAMGTLIISFILLVINDKNRVGINIIVGFLFALSVLCCPYLVVLYVLYIIVVIVNSIKRNKSKNSLYTFKTVLFITLGIGVVAIAFISYVLMHSSLSDIIKSIPFIINDPSHDTTVSVFVKFIDFFKFILFSADYKMIAVYGAFIIEVIITIIDKKRQEHKVIYIIISLILSIIGVIICALTGFVNMILFPAQIVVIESLLLSSQQTTGKLMCQFWIPAMIYTFLLNMTSNQEYVAISSSSIVALVVGIVMVISESEHAHKATIVKTLLAFYYVIIIVLCIGFRFYSVVGDSNIYEQEYEITKGPEKGIIGSQEKSREYEETYDLIKSIQNEYGAQSFVYVGTLYEWIQKTTYYLIDGLKNSSCSAWMLYGDKTDIMQNYYKINPDKIPDMILVFTLPEEEDYLEFLREEVPYKMVYDKEGKKVFVKEAL